MLRERLRYLFLEFLIVLLAFVAQARGSEVFHFRPDFLLAALIASIFFLRFFFVLFGASVGILLLSWPLSSGVEGLLVFSLPLFFFLIKDFFFRFTPWLNVFLAVASGVVLFYLITSPPFLPGNYGIILSDIVVSGIFGMLIAGLLRYYKGGAVFA